MLPSTKVRISARDGKWRFVRTFFSERSLGKDVQRKLSKFPQAAYIFPSFRSLRRYRGGFLCGSPHALRLTSKNRRGSDRKKSTAKPTQSKGVRQFRKFGCGSSLASFAAWRSLRTPRGRGLDSSPVVKFRSARTAERALDYHAKTAKARRTQRLE